MTQRLPLPRHIDALEAIERMADLGVRGADPVASLKYIREAAMAALGRPLVSPPPEPKALTVRVLSAEQYAWYSESIGETFVVREFGRGYVLAEDYDRGYEHAWRHISKDDVEVVPA